MNRIEYNDNLHPYNKRHSYVDQYSTSSKSNNLRAGGNMVEKNNSAYGHRHTFDSSCERGQEIYTRKHMKFDAEGLKTKIKCNEFINDKIALIAEWLEVDDKSLRVEGVRKPIPAKWVAVIAAISISLMLVVSGAVISSKALMELYSSQNELAELQNIQAELERELELKNDLRYIEKVAREELGMIDREHGAVQYINNELSNKVEIYENNKVYSKISSLLDSFAFFGE